MQVVGTASAGVVLLFVAGFVRGSQDLASDPELSLGLFLALGGAGLTCIVAAGVAWGLAMGRGRAG